MPSLLPLFVTFFFSSCLTGVVCAWISKQQQSKHQKEDAFTIAGKINGLLLQSSQGTTVLQKIADFLPNELDFATGVVVLYEKNEHMLRRVAASNTTEAQEAIRALRIPFNQIAIPVSEQQNLLSRAIREKKEFVTGNVYDVFVPVFSQEESLNIQHIMGTQATLVYPMYLEDEPLGVFIASTKKPVTAITPYEKEIIRLFVDGAAIALHNTRLITSLQETTEQLRNANMQIGRANKMKEDLLTMASHEFRTPLSIIKNSVWLIHNNAVLGKMTEKERQNFERLAQSVDRLDYVVNNINQMLLATSGDLASQMHFEAVQIERLIKEVLKDKEIEAFDQAIKLSYQEPASLLPSIQGDGIKLKYMLYELLTNALKYTPRDGSIVVTSEKVNNTVVIQIQDTGKGIAPEYIPKLFQSFEKANIMQTTQSGMGLGLYVVKEIVDLHKGTINIVSSEGKGTTVTISLPVRSE